MAWQQYIERNPQVLSGKPIIKGTRISVELVMRKLAGGNTFEQLLNAYPHLQREQLEAACEYAADVIANEEITEDS
ncbi:MAG: DUF433 domain-containing protein [Bacteroidota bacterium]|nr:DUF433 domain-containing protein [Bacteroidota bacterium]